jgi:hypothetical protein
LSLMECGELAVNFNKCLYHLGIVFEGEKCEFF